jgi:hypothetical protein
LKSDDQKKNEEIKAAKIVTQKRISDVLSHFRNGGILKCTIEGDFVNTEYYYRNKESP